MSDKKYTVEKGTQILISLLKEFGIRKIIASPGATNVAFVGSVQSDPYFEVYSSVDERSAAYMACGMAAQSGEPVVIVCTGATASRNYLPGLTEAYYRKLPVLAVTYNTGIHNLGHLRPQQIDRRNIQDDVACEAIDVPIIKDFNDAWLANVNINKALLSLNYHGGGPVHINISTEYSPEFSVDELPKQRVIRRILADSKFPDINPDDKKIAIFISSHSQIDQATTDAIDQFCEENNSVVFCDHTGGYHGKYRILSSLLGSQQQVCPVLADIDLLIHLGEVSGDYFFPVHPKKVWRVNPDGQVKDTFRTLQYVFEMEEKVFFNAYIGEKAYDTSYYDSCVAFDKELRSHFPELPLSNIWIARQTAQKLPSNSLLHLAILNSLRAWNFFELPDGIESVSNVGGFGIDGVMSSALGASLACPERKCFVVIGDLAFFYDLNSLGNRHITENMRILLINNGKGAEFTNYSHLAAQTGKALEPFIAAAGHFGGQSPCLVRHFTEDLGFEYITASSKEEYLEHLEHFTSSESFGRPIVFEVFTDSEQESEALKLVQNIISVSPDIKEKIKSGIKSIIGDKGVRIINIIRE